MYCTYVLQHVQVRSAEEQGYISAYDKDWKLSGHLLFFCRLNEFPTLIMLLLMYDKFVCPNMVWLNKCSIWPENVWWLAVIISPVHDFWQDINFGTLFSLMASHAYVWCFCLDFCPVRGCYICLWHCSETFMYAIDALGTYVVSLHADRGMYLCMYVCMYIPFRSYVIICNYLFWRHITI